MNQFFNLRVSQLSDSSGNGKEFFDLLKPSNLRRLKKHKKGLLPSFGS